MDEPSVLDYIKSKLLFWKGETVVIPEVEIQEEPELTPVIDGKTRPEGFPEPDLTADEQPEWEKISVPVLETEMRPVVPPREEPILQPPAEPATLPRKKPQTLPEPRPSGSIWRAARILGVLLLAILAQRFLEPPNRVQTSGIVFYALATALLIWVYLRGGWKLAPLPEANIRSTPQHIRRLPLFIAVPLALVAFAMFAGNLFTQINLIIWGLALITFIWAFWVRDPQPLPFLRKFRANIAQLIKRGLTFSPWTLLVIGVFALLAFFRFYQLEQVPPEMFSDHAEKLLDISDVLKGETHIFFPRNTGREAFQMYLTASVSLILGTGLSFISLKIGTALAGLLTLPYIYLLGKEAGNRRVGLLAMAFVGIAYWPNVISRVALRFALFPLFAAPTIYYLIRGLRTRNRNDFIFAGLALGLGLHGYSPFRFMPFVVLVALGLYLLHRQSRGNRRNALIALSVLVVISVVIFLPLGRYALSDPEGFTRRTLTRLTDLEHPLPGPALQIFAQNLWKAMTMFFWDNGEIWVHSVTHRPALDIVTASLFFLGVVLLIIRYLRKRNWLDIFLLGSIPLLMMPSILSLAFPAENPSLNRTGGTIIPIFIIVGLSLDGLMTSLKSSFTPMVGKLFAWGLCILLFSWSASQNYDLVFNQYYQQFRLSSWNTSELGAVIRQFTDTVGEEDSAWVVPYPHWVDTRLVGINAGFPQRDYARWPDQLADTLPDTRAKLFLFKPEDEEARRLLQELYPQGAMGLYDSEIEGKDFWMYFVPPHVAPPHD